jgi:hypothetical protein
MRSHCAIIVDPVNITDIDNDRMYDDWWSLLLITFPEDIANYLTELRNTTIRSLTDLIEFNLNHTNEEFHPEFAPNQLVFEWSNNLSNLSYVNQSSLLNKTRVWARELCIDAA